MKGRRTITLSREEFEAVTRALHIVKAMDECDGNKNQEDLAKTVLNKLFDEKYTRVLRDDEIPLIGHERPSGDVEASVEHKGRSYQGILYRTEST